MCKIVRRGRASRLAMVMVPFAALGMSVIASLVLFALYGKSPALALHALLLEPFLSWQSFSEVLLKMTPLLPIAQGLAIGFRANVFDIGAEGQYVMGAIAASALPVYFPKGDSMLMLPAMPLLGAMGGMLWASIAAGLRTRFNTNEILVTLMLMLSLIAIQVLNYLLLGPWKDPKGFNFPQSVMFPDATMLPTLIPGTRVSVALLLAGLVTVLAFVMMRYSFSGYKLLLGGLAPRADSYAGFSEKRAVWISLLIGGCAAGLAGACEVSGPLGQLQRSIPVGYGYAAIIAAYLGGLNPLGILASAFLMSVIYIGGDNAMVSADLPIAAVRVFQGMLLVFYLAGFTFIRYRLEFRRGQAVNVA